MKWTSVFFSICIFLCVIFSVKGKVQAQEDVFSGGDLLFARGQFFEAAIAYERVFYSAEDASLRVLANLRKSQALKQQGEYARVVYDLQRSLPYAPDDSLRAAILYEMAFCSYMSGVYPQARSLLQQLEVQYPQSYQAQAISLLKGMVLVKMKDWEGLEEYLDGLQAGQTSDAVKDTLAGELRFLLGEDQRPVERQPEKARLWSTFLPGAGHLYAGEPGQGILNGFSQLASLGVAGLMAYNQLYISGFIVGLGLFQSFYFGGIRHAGELTEERNLREMNAYQQSIQELLLGIHQPHRHEP